MTPVEKLRERMVGKIEAALITSDINRRYFTGMRSSAGTLVVFPDSAYLCIRNKQVNVFSRLQIY